MKRFSALFCLLAPSVLWAAEGASSQPYIDSLLQKQKEEAGEETSQPPESYTEKLKKKLAEEEAQSGGNPGESYIERLRREDPDRFGKPQDSHYTETLKQKLEPGEVGGAIRAVQEGRSELKPRYKDGYTGAFAVRYAAVATRSYNGNAESVYQPFASVYGGNYVPEIGFFYEHQPFHSEIFGNLGLVGGVSISYAHGSGAFQTDLPKPWGGGNFGAPRTLFQFWTIPVSLGANYRFNLLHYLRPFVQALPTLTLYSEDRNDGVDAKKGFSLAFQWSGGVSILMDWLSPSGAWDAYHQNGIRHTYLTLEYAVVTPIASPVTFGQNGLYGGITFEF